MSFSWSHTDEAYDNVYQNILRLTPTLLQIAWAEIKTYEILIKQENLVRYEVFEDSVEETGESFNEFNKEIYIRLLEYAKDLDYAILVSDIWKFTSDHRECDNGGYNAYITPYNTLMVSFSPPEKWEEKEE